MGKGNGDGTNARGVVGGDDGTIYTVTVYLDSLKLIKRLMLVLRSAHLSQIWLYFVL